MRTWNERWSTTSHQSGSHSSKTRTSPESVDAGRVLDSDGLASVVDVAVLADPLVVAGGLLLGDGAVLLGEGGPKLAIAHVEPLLLQDSGERGVALELGGGKGRGSQQGDLEVNGQVGVGATFSSNYPNYPCFEY